MRPILQGSVSELLCYEYTINKDILLYRSGKDNLIVLINGDVSCVWPIDPPYNVRASIHENEIRVLIGHNLKLYKGFEEFSGNVLWKLWKSLSLPVGAVDCGFLNDDLVTVTSDSVQYKDRSVKLPGGTPKEQFKCIQLNSQLLCVFSSFVVYTFNSNAELTQIGTTFSSKIHSVYKLGDRFLCVETENSAKFVWDLRSKELKYSVSNSFITYEEDLLVVHDSELYNLTKGVQTGCDDVLKLSNFSGLEHGYTFIGGNYYYFHTHTDGTTNGATNSMRLITGLESTSEMFSANMGGGWLFGSTIFSSDFKRKLQMEEFVKPPLEFTDGIAILNNESEIIFYQDFEEFSRLKLSLTPLFIVQLQGEYIGCVYNTHVDLYDRGLNFMKSYEFDFKPQFGYNSRLYKVGRHSKVLDFVTNEQRSLPEINGHLLDVNDEYIVYTRDFTTTLLHLPTSTPDSSTNLVKLGRMAVDIAWSGNFLAMLCPDLEIYVKTIPARGSFSLIYETKDVEDCQSVVWKTESKELLLFNGRRVYEHEIEFGKVRDRIANDYSLVLTEQDNIVTVLNTKLPIYHPNVLGMFLAARKLPYLLNILDVLLARIKFSSNTENGILMLPYDLNLDLTNESLKTELPSQTVCPDLQKMLSSSELKLQGLTKANLNSLKNLTVILNNSAEVLDDMALCSLYLLPDFPCDSWVYAILSNTKQELADRTPEILHHYLDRKQLSMELENLAKREFAKTRDPTSVSLYYLALRKKEVIQTLWRISSSPEKDKTVKLLKNDFTTERWRIAAQKNAYALLSKHRVHYAAAFFLLGDSIKDCCQILVSKLNDLPLAISIARVFDGDSGVGMEFLNSKYMNSSPALMFYGLWIRGLYEDAINVLQKPENRGVGYNGVLLSILKKPFYEPQLDTHQRFYGLVSTDVNPLNLDLLIEQKGTTSNVNTTQGKQEDTGSEKKQESEEHTVSKDDNAETQKDKTIKPSFKPPPADLQLEPDMSAFGF